MRVKIDIDNGYHSRIVGNKGIVIQQLRGETGCDINMPNRKLDSQEIEIIGPTQEAVDLCIEKIRTIASTSK